jgi:hypothetical protein
MNQVEIDGIRYTVALDGILIPRNKMPTTIPTGYTFVKGKLIPVLPDCKHRVLETRHSNCCHHDFTVIRCSLKGKIVRRLICVGCKDAE